MLLFLFIDQKYFIFHNLNHMEQALLYTKNQAYLKGEIDHLILTVEFIELALFSYLIRKGDQIS